MQAPFPKSRALCEMQPSPHRLKASLVEALAARDASAGVAGPRALIDTDSPAEHAIRLLNRFLEGALVAPRSVSSECFFFSERWKRWRGIL